MLSAMNADRSIRRLAWWVSGGVAAGLAAIFLWVPTDDFQGVVQRIFYVHVPAVWAAYTAFTIVAIASVAYLWKGARRWDMLAHAAAEAGLLFTVVNLLTGMLWGRPIWNAYWAWDARLTSTFVMALVYAGYLALRAMATDAERGARIAAVIGVLGVIEIPIIHLSVLLWRGQHPEPVLTPRPELPGEMLVTLLFMTVVFMLLLVLMVRLRLRVARLEDEALRLEIGDLGPRRPPMASPAGSPAAAGEGG
jgi:heme exporter protein C